MLLFEFISLLPFAPVLVVLYIFFFPPLFKKGKIEYAYLYLEAGQYYLIILHNFSSVYVGKGGSSERHRYRVKKLKLPSGELVYDAPFSSFGAGFLNGYLNVTGLSGHFLYLTSSKHSLAILDLNTGRLAAKKRDLLAKNPEVIDITNEEMELDPQSGLLKVYNIEGKRFEIDPNTLLMRPVGENNKREFVPLHQNIFEWPNFEDRISRMTSFGQEITIKVGNDSFEVNLKFESEENSKRSYLKVESGKFGFHINKNKELEKQFDRTENSASFINPIILARYSNLPHYDNPLRVLIKHQAFIERDEDRDNTYIALVNGRSEVLWQVRYPSIIHKKLLKSTEHQLYLFMDKEMIWCFFSDQHEAFMSVSNVAVETGNVEMEPLLIQNHWWEKKRLKA